MAEGQTLVEVDPDICELEYERYLTLQRARRKLRASLMWLKLRRGAAEGGGDGEGGDGVGGGGGETKASQDDPQVVAKLQALAKQVRDITSTSTGVCVCGWVCGCVCVHHTCARCGTPSMPYFHRIDALF